MNESRAIRSLLKCWVPTGELRFLANQPATSRRTKSRSSARPARPTAQATTSRLPAPKNDHEKLLAREKPSYDGAEPSGNSVEALNLLRLSEFTTQDRYRERADRLLRSFQARLAEAPTSLSELLLTVDFRLDAPKEVIIVVPRSRAEAEPFLARLRRAFLPNRVLAVGVVGADQKDQEKLVTLLQDKTPQDGKATAYVCEGGVCKLPTTDPDVFARQIRETRPLDAASSKKALLPSPGG